MKGTPVARDNPGTKPSVIAACVLATAIAVALPPDPAVAGPQGGLTTSEAAARAQALYGGRVLSVKRLSMTHPGAPAYQVKLLDKGNVRTVTIRSDQ